VVHTICQSVAADFSLCCYFCAEPSLDLSHLCIKCILICTSHTLKLTHSVRPSAPVDCFADVYVVSN